MKIVSALPMLLVLAFAGCATTPAPTGDGWANLSQTTRAGPVLVQPLRVIEDSRCPKNARCVWAGRAVFAVRLTVDGQQSTAEMVAYEPLPLAGGRLTIDALNPESYVTGEQPQPGDYELHFSYRATGQ